MISENGGETHIQQAALRVRVNMEISILVIADESSEVQPIGRVHATAFSRIVVFISIVSQRDKHLKFRDPSRSISCNVTMKSELHSTVAVARV